MTGTGIDNGARWAVSQLPGERQGLAHAAWWIEHVRMEPAQVLSRKFPLFQPVCRAIAIETDGKHLPIPGQAAFPFGGCPQWMHLPLSFASDPNYENQAQQRHNCFKSKAVRVEFGRGIVISKTLAP